MPEVSFIGLLLIAAIAFGAPLLLGLAPRLQLPAVVLEIVSGIIIGPSVLGWIELDLPIEILSVLGLAFLLFLAGLEVEPERFRGQFLRVSVIGLIISFSLALGIAYGLGAAGAIDDPLIVAIILLATSLGLVIPLLKDAGQASSSFGQLTIAGSSLADFAAVILLSLFFSREATGAVVKLLLLGGFLALLAAFALAIARAGRSRRISEELVRLQDTTSEIRVRGAIVLFLGVVALAERFGLEVILGAFLAGAVLKLLDRDVMMSHPFFHAKLEAIGFGFLVPVFFISSGVSFDLHSLLSSGSAIASVPLFLAALFVIRGAPALLYRPLIGTRRTLAATLLQATSLPFIVAASQIGMELRVLSPPRRVPVWWLRGCSRYWSSPSSRSPCCEGARPLPDQNGLLRRPRKRGKATTITPREDSRRFRRPTGSTTDP
jgi:Kef-type K+ transport system membrane component KefB